MTYVKLDQNNSGGSFWLSDAQFDALLADGWVPVDDYRGTRWGRHAQNLALDVPVEDPHHVVTIAEIEFGRVTGEIISMKLHENAYGTREVMTVKDERGFKVWGTQPRSLYEAQKGDKVTFLATVEVSDRDEFFGFFRRPTRAQIAC